MSQLKNGAILSYLNIILTNVIGLLLTPFIIRSLGDSEYGLYTLIGSLIAYISVLDFGLNNTIVRFVARYRAKNDSKGEENFIATTLIIYGIISFIIVVLGLVLYFNLDAVFKNLNAIELEKAKIMFAILIFNLGISLPGGAFAAICSGYEKFVFPRALTIIKYIVRSILIVGLLLFGGDSVGIVILDTVVNILVILINIYFVLKILKVKIHLHFLEKNLFKEIFSYSIWIFIFAMVGQFQWTSGQVILGIVSNTTTVAIYGVGIMLGTYYGAFSTAISGVFLPRATKMTVLDATGTELTDMMIKIGRYSLLVLLFILGGFILFGQQFIYLWVGKTYADSWIIALMVMVAYTLPLTQAFANSILEAKSKFSYKAICYISLLALGTLLGALLVKQYGVIGLISGTTLGWVVSQVIMNFYYHNKLNLEIPRFFMEVSNRILPLFFILVGISYFLYLIPGLGWINLLNKIINYSILFSFLMFKFGVNQEEKSTFISLIPKFLSKK